VLLALPQAIVCNAPLLLQLFASAATLVTCSPQTILARAVTVHAQLAVLPMLMLVLPVPLDLLSTIILASFQTMITIVI
jgi:hypothetical protein